MASKLVHIASAAALLLLAGLVSGDAWAQTADQKNFSVATFAGGCFWCVESDFDKVPGVVSTTSGYTGGHLDNPTYRQVTVGDTGHREAVKIVFDPKVVTYERLLHVFWRSVDPTDAGGQFCDRGESYATAIFATNAEQRALAEASKAKLEKAGVLTKPIVTPIEDAGEFYPAEDYHQDYYTKNPVRYKFYRYSCGRNKRIKSVWGDQAMDGIPKS